MGREYKERVEPEESFYCDICGGEIAGEPFVPDCHVDSDDLCFHEECWNNAQDWVSDCPETLFADGDYGKRVEAVRNGKWLVFFEGDEDAPRCVICEDRQEVDGLAQEISFDQDETIVGVVHDGVFYSACVESHVVINGIDN